MTMKAAALLILLATLVSFGCGTNRGNRSDLDDIRESVFRWQFDHSLQKGSVNAQVYFLAVDAGDDNQFATGTEHDPADLFMKRFAKQKPQVRKRSSCSLEGGIFDKQTGERGIIFFVNTILRKSEVEVQVTAGYYAGGWGSSGSIYTLTKQEGRWKVTNEEPAWVG